MLPRQTFVHNSALAHSRLEGFQLRISAPRLRAIGKANSARLQIVVQSFQQMRAADMVNRYAAAADGPPLDLHAVAMATNARQSRAAQGSSNCSA